MLQHQIDDSRVTHSRWRRLALAIALSTLGCGVLLIGGATSLVGEPLLLDDARMIIEFNDTDQDVGIQMFIDGDEWRLLRVFNPDNVKLLEIRASSSIRRQGLSELFFESSEPSLDELSLEDFLRRFPEGEYVLRGTTIDGEAIEGTAIFTHIIPDAPEILSPEEDSVQDPDDVVVDWLPSPDPPGSTIIAYQVIVTQERNVLPERVFSAHVPATVTRMHVPAEFLRHGADYEFEILAIEAGGNQTIAASFFSTMD